jgi:acylglycerol lipase
VTVLRRLAALLLLAALAACAGQNDGRIAMLEKLAAGMPQPIPLTKPAPAPYRFAAEDGAALPLRVWLPEGPVKAVIIGVHGMNDYSNALTGPAEAWAKDGIATYAYDQRGFGEAPMRGGWAGTRQLDADLAAASRFVRARHPGVPIYLLGESMGGAVVITAVTGAAGARRPVCDGIILAAPAVWGRSTMNIFERVALWTADALIPGATVTGRGLGRLPSDNIAMLRALSRDPLVIKETRIEAVNGLVDLMDAALAAAPRLDVPLLLLDGQHDELIPREPIRLFVAHLPKAAPGTRRIAWYAHGYHMLLRDLEAATVMRDVASWITDRRAPLPSGADRDTAPLMAAEP